MFSPRRNHSLALLGVLAAVSAVHCVSSPDEGEHIASNVNNATDDHFALDDFASSYSDGGYAKCGAGMWSSSP